MLQKKWGILTAAAAMALCLGAAGQGWAGSDANARANAPKIGFRVDSVVASDTNEGIDPQLTPMAPRLHSLFSYSTYHLINHQEQQTPMGTLILFNLPGGRILHVQPRGMDGDMIAMELILFQGEQPLMTTDLKMRNHGLLMVGGPRYEQGELILTIGADCRCPRPRTADASAMPGQAPVGTPQSAATE